MASNVKSKSPGKEAPTEPFKRAVTGCLRAIARQPELEVSFAAERPGLAGGKARLPEPPRKLTAVDAAIVRGHADLIALRMACHDAAVHRKLIPGSQQARAVFEAVEQARVEAIGARRMQGVAGNLAAMLDDRFHRGKFDDITDRADAPIEDAVAMLVRERLTGQAPPPAAKKLVELWRNFIEDRAGRELDRLEKLVEDQRRFGDVVHDLLDSLDMGDQRSRDEDDDYDADQNDDGQKDEQGQEGETADSEDSERIERRGCAGVRRRNAGRRRGLERSARLRHAGGQRDRRPGLPRPSRGGRAIMASTSRAVPTTSRSHRASTKPSAPRNCASRMNSSACVAISTSSLPICRASCRASPTACSAG